jgi:hypothetical protein
VFAGTTNLLPAAGLFGRMAPGAGGHLGFDLVTTDGTTHLRVVAALLRGEVV